MPGKRYRFTHGPHRVRIVAAQAGNQQVQVQTRDGLTYTAPMKELRPIPQPSTRRSSRKRVHKHQLQKGGNRVPQRSDKNRSRGDRSRTRPKLRRPGR